MNRNRRIGSEFLQANLLVVVLAAACLFYLLALSSNRFGAYHDDGIYVATAKALATGQGYRIISLPYEPAQTKYPPFYPLLLSLIWKLYPVFPSNVTAMMVLSMIFALGFLALTWRYLVALGYLTRWQALIVVSMSALNWRMMILATSVYSEMLFSLLTIGSLHLAERYEKTSQSRRLGLALGVLIGLAFLTRSPGITLLVSIVAYYGLRRQWKRAMLPAAVASLFVVGWIVWCSLNRTAAQVANVTYYTSYLSHLNEVVSDIQAQSGSSRLGVFLSMAIENVVGGILISVPLVSSGLSYKSFSGLSGTVLAAALGGAFLCMLLIAMGFIRTLAERVRLLHIYVVACLGLYLFWLPGVSYDRFLMTLLPFLLLFLVTEFGRLASMAKEALASAAPSLRISGGLIAVMLTVVASMSVYGYTSGAVSSLQSLHQRSARASEDAIAIDWIKEHTDPSDTLVCYRDPKYFLYTGHKAVRSFPMTEGYSWQDDDAAMSKLAAAVFRIVDDANARYVVVTSSDFELEDRPEQHREVFNRLIEQHRGNFVLVFESEDGLVRIYRIENSGTQGSH